MGKYDDLIQVASAQKPKAKYSDLLEATKEEALPSKKPGLLSETASEFADIGKRAVGGVVEAGKKYAAGERGLAETALAGGAAGANLLFDIPLLGIKTAAKAITPEGAGKAVGGAAKTVLGGIGKIIPDAAKQAAAKLGKKWGELSPREQENIVNALSVGSSVPIGKVAGSGLKATVKAGEKVLPALKPIGKKLATEAGEVATTAVEKVKTLPERITESPVTAKIKREVEAGKRAGFTFTRAEETAISPGKPSSGFWAGVERATRSMPLSQGVYIKRNERNAEVVVNALEKNLGEKIGNIDERFAQKVADSIEANMKAEKDKFSAAYADLIAKGKVSYVDEAKVADKVAARLAKNADLNFIPEEEKTRILSYVDKIRSVGSKPIEGGTLKVKAGIGSNYESFKNMTSLIGSEKRRMFDKLSTGAAGMTDQQAAKAAKIYSDIYDTMKAAEYNHLRVVGGNDLVNSLKMIDRKYAEGKGSLDIAKRIFGIGREVGEKGFVESETALAKLTDPKHLSRFETAMKIATPDTKQNVGRALFAKIIKESGGADSFSAVKYQNAYQKYKPVFERVLDKNQLGKLDDLSIGMKRANIQTINLLDPTNPSGTGAKSIIGSILGGLIAGESIKGVTGGILGGGIGGVALAGGILGGSRVLAKIATRTPLSNTDKAILALLRGTGTGIAVDIASEKEHAGTAGFAAGAAAPSVYKAISKLRR